MSRASTDVGVCDLGPALATFCSRDRFGAKPFYYYLDDDVFVFASEIKGILPALKARPRPNHSVIADYLVDGTVCRTAETFFEEIVRLPPAHNLVVSGGASRETRYWDYTTRSHVYDERDPVETFGEPFRRCALAAAQRRTGRRCPSGGLTQRRSPRRRTGERRPLHASHGHLPGNASTRKIRETRGDHCGAELTVVTLEHGRRPAASSAPSTIPPCFPGSPQVEPQAWRRRSKSFSKDRERMKCLAGYAELCPTVPGDRVHAISGDRADVLDLFAARRVISGARSARLCLERAAKPETATSARRRLPMTSRCPTSASARAGRRAVSRSSDPQDARRPCASAAQRRLLGDAISMAHFGVVSPFLDCRLVDLPSPSRPSCPRGRRRSPRCHG